MPTPSKKPRSPKEYQSDLEWLNDAKGDRKKNGRTAKHKFMRIVNNNFDENSKFLTLTFAENMTDVEVANQMFNKFIKRLKYHFEKTEGNDNISYVVAIEFQARGAVHYHLLINMPYIVKQKLAEIWGHGFIKINKLKKKEIISLEGNQVEMRDISHVDNVGAYLSKYMSKTEKDLRLKDKKQFWASRNIEHPIAFKGEEADEIITVYGIDKMTPVINTEYPSEHHGQIQYEQFNLNRKTKTEGNEDETD